MEFSELIGKHLTSVTGLDRGSSAIKFNTSDGEEYVMEHYQDCCEHVAVEDICGDVNDLQDATVLSASEDSSQDTTVRDEYDDGISLWTFYNIATNKGHVTIRWYGSSNGYYGVGVSFYKENAEGTGRWD
jgi:hypothetical protein